MGLQNSLLGVMELEPNSYTWKDVGSLTVTWLQDAGGFAAIGLLLWFIYVMATPAPAVAGSRRQLISRFMAVTGVCALIVYLVALAITVFMYLNEPKAAASKQPQQLRPGQVAEPEPETPLGKAQNTTLAIAGALALAAFCEPFLLDLGRLRRRRVYALAKLSFKEAVRRRIVWVFFIFFLVFLFPVGWFSPHGVKPEDMLKRSIDVIAISMTVLMVLTALLLSGFSIPSDVKNQTIHTIVTKPVERFEIVAGRFLGYVALLSIALVLMTGASVIVILTSDVDEASQKESMKARVPEYGTLRLLREKVENDRVQQQAFTGIDVGREYTYRKYIAGRSSHRAIWEFTDGSELRVLSDKPVVTLEYAFDVYRTTKGEENRGVRCDFDLVTWKWDPTRQNEYKREITEKCGSYPANVRPEDETKWRLANEIAEKYGRYELGGIQVYDYHTFPLSVPPGVLKNAIEGAPPKDYPLQVASRPVLLQVKVKCDSPSQFIGVAPLDLYFLESDGSFWRNFFKEAVGLWCRLCIVTGLAVAASTYFAGVISFLLAAALFIAGYFQTFIKGIAAGGNEGGGPLESFTRLVEGKTVNAPLDTTPTVQIALGGDAAFRWLLRRVVNVIPDTERFAWDNYLAQGFSIRVDFILLNVLFMAAYLLPWAVLAYYLMRSREIAA
jgi:ABC-2 family transporter protein